MKARSRNFRIITYGQAFSELGSTGLGEAVRGINVSRTWNQSPARLRDTGEYLLVSSGEMNEAFTKAFRERATHATRLLVLLDKSISADQLISRIVDLQIRTAQRFYVMDPAAGMEKSHCVALVHSLLKRLISAITADDKEERVLDARLEDGVLHVVSPDFSRLDVPIAKIAQLRTAEPSQTRNFEIDEDGAFVYWPDIDLHLGWSQLQQVVEPDAARKALQKSQQFNIRYGKAVQKVREAAGLKPTDVAGLSEKQLRRIEKGECRLTSNGIEALSKAHGLKANEYLQRLAEALSNGETRV